MEGWENWRFANDFGYFHTKKYFEYQEIYATLILYGTGWNFASFLQKEVIRFDLCLLELPYCQKRESGDIVWVDCFVHSTGRKCSGI